jgi:hypothetical protein
MNRRTYFGVSMAIIASLAGCARRTAPPPATKGTGGVDAIPMRRLSKAELEADMADRLKFHDVALTDQGGGRFTGSGKDADGRLFELEVTQDDHRRSWIWKGKRLSKVELEADMAKGLKLHDVALTDQGGGRFTGSGKNADGRPVELEVTEDDKGRSWKYKWTEPDGPHEVSGFAAGSAGASINY